MPFSHPFLGEGSPAKGRLQKKVGALILTSPLENLDDHSGSVLRRERGRLRPPGRHHQVWGFAIEHLGKAAHHGSCHEKNRRLGVGQY